MYGAAHDRWKIDTRDDLEALINNDQPVSHEQDSVAWHVKQAGHLARREFDRIDLPTLIDVLTDTANKKLFHARSRCCDIIETLLVLCYAPEAGNDTRTDWKRDLSCSRIQFSKILGRSPSLRRFLRPMLAYGWFVGRMNAAMQLSAGHYLPIEIRQEVLQSERLSGDWIERLPAQCPWSPVDILGYGAADPHAVLNDSYSLPFEGPKAAPPAR